MKKLRPLCLLLVCLLAVILAVVLRGGKAPVAESAGSPPESAVLVAENAEPDVMPLPEAVEAAAEPAALAAEEAVAEVPEDWEKRTISEEWTDGPEKLAGRQRVRIVEADFKYPNLRLEESVATDPETGLETVTLIRASVADHLMLGLKRGADPELAAAAVRKMGYEVRAIEPGSHILAEIPMFDAAKDHARAAADLASLEEFINHAEPDYLVFPCLTPNDPAYAQGKMWGLHNPGTSADSIRDADIDAPEGWDIRKDAPGIVVAVTDTGIQYNHEDLAANMWTHPTNGSHGFDAYENDNDPMDTGGHGTHCAGTIGGRGGNSKGLTGVAWDVKLMAVRFLGPNGGTTSDAIRSVNYARQNGARVISASWGGGGYSQSLYDAIKACGDAGIPFVAAAGNSSTNNDSTPHYPSSYKLENIVSVASTTKTDTLSSFSCYGRTSVDIAAPGSSIWSSYIGSSTAYTFLNGTSMATPHVSGALALALAHFPTEDMNSVIARLYGSVDKIPSLAGRVASGGRLNLARLLGGSPPNVFNDDFADAHRFTDVYGSWVGTNARATREPDEDSFAGPGIGNKSLWLAFRTPHAGLVSLDITSEILGFEIIVFEGGEKGQLKRVAQSDRLGSFYRFIRFNAKADTEYRVVLDTYIVPDQRWRVDYYLAPPNDFFADATPLAGEFFAVSGYNRAATNEMFEKIKPHAGTGRGKTVWWSWTAPESGNFIINTSGSAFDTVLAVYTGANANSLTAVASNEDRSPLDWTSQVTIPAVAGTTYRIAVDSFRDNAVGEIKLNGFRSGMLNIIRQPASLSVELGKRAVFDVSVLSDGDISYQWFFKDKAMPGQTSANLVIDPVRTEDFGNYKVQAWNTENLVTSSNAVLSEKQSAPALAWSSGNQAVASGTAVTLAANFSGSVPMTFAWTRNGQPVAGTAASLTFASAQVANAGAYRLTATNTAGSATADFTLSVVTSPWERWEWRRPGIPNAAITDIKVYGTDAFALSGNAILRSSDGETWSKSLFPQGFTAKSMAKAGSLFVCLGHDPSKNLRFATSANGTAWTVSSPTGTTWTGIFGSTEYKLSSFKSHFIATGPNSGGVFRSTDGLAWTRIQATNLAGQTVNLSGNGVPASNGSKLILASTSSASSNRLQYFQSTDGISWTERPTQDGTTSGYSSGTPNTAFYALGKFYLFATYSIYSSADGENWTYHYAPSNGIATTSMFGAAGGNVFAFQPSQTYYHFSDPAALTWKQSYPSQSQNFSAAATYGNRLIFGTDKGLLKTASDASGITIPSGRVTPLASLHFEDGLFAARSTDPGYSSFPPNLVSGDGVTWKTAHPLNVPITAYAGRAYGRYWGGIAGYNIPVHAGYNPFDIRPAENAAPGVGTNLLFIGEAGNASALAISSPDHGSYAYQIHRRADANAAWTAVTYPVTVSSDLRFTCIDNRWFSSSTQGWNSYPIYTSTTGTTWVSTGITGSNAIFVKHAGAVHSFYQSGSFTALKMSKSTNGGSTWEAAVNATGLPATDLQIFAKRIVSFGGNLVLLANNQRLYFSQNGTTWLEGYVPAPVTEIAVGNGKLVAVTSNGGLLETGAVHAGANAPLVAILSPQPTSTHLMSSQVIVEGTLSDPEDGSASFQAFLDGDLVASGSGTTFRFPVTTSSLSGHTVTVMATDSRGLKQMDSIRLKLALPEPDNLLRDAEGKTFLPTRHATVLDGVFYVAAARSLYRSLDGVSWERVAIPGLADTIYGIAAGNGSLVVQFDNGGIITTRDGINWTHFQPNQTNYWVRTPVRFSDGVFIAAYQNQGTTTGSVMVSADGLAWSTGSVSEDGYLSWVARNPAGTLVGMRGYGGGVVRSTDSGSNWQLISEFPATFGQSTQGFFANGRFVVLEPTNARTQTSSDSYTWTQNPLPVGIVGSASISLVGDTFFLGSGTSATHSSRNGANWKATTHPIRFAALSYARGVFLAVSGDGMVRSADGVTWTPIESPCPVADVTKILGNENVHLVIDSKGATWVSEDTETWTAHLPGATIPSFDSRLGNEIVKIGGKLIAGGSVFQTSSDDGLSWSAPNLNGSPAANINVVRIASSGTAVIAAVNSQNIVVRSTNGNDFSTVASLPVKAWADVAWNGSEWMLLAKDGSLFRSNNNGLTWLAVAESASLRIGAAITWYNGRWVIIGSDNATFNSPYTCFNLTSGGVFTKHSVIGFYNSNFEVRTLIAHGKLVVWVRGEESFVSTTGNTWTKANLRAGVGNHDFDIYHTPEGFTAFVGSTVSFYPVVAWKSGPDGLDWASAPAPFNSVVQAHNLDDRLFVFAAGVIAEIHDYDFSLTLPSFAPVTLGVGDSVKPTVTIKNNGYTLPTGKKWAVTAWLSRTRFFRDGKDIPIGTFDITTAMPVAGAQITIPLTFVLPNEISTGNNHLILSLVSLSGVRERNTPNNTVISDTAAINIPEWEFAVATNGNGQVNRDFAATRYPHKAQVSLTASAGKGATFTGWAGDALSPNDQITILMDGNKSVQANFSNRSTLQVFVNGMGEVTGLPDFGSYTLSATAVITAVPAPGWVFSHWSGASSVNTPAASILMNVSKTATANFILPVATWKTSKFNAQQLANPAISGDQMDPDSDGILNWMEYLHGSNPMDNKSRGSTPFTIENGFLRCVYTRNIGPAGGGSLTCEAGRDLLGWTSTALEQRILSNIDGIETVEARFPVAGQGMGFIRFRYNPPQP